MTQSNDVPLKGRLNYAKERLHHTINGATGLRWGNHGAASLKVSFDFNGSVVETFIPIPFICESSQVRCPGDTGSLHVVEFFAELRGWLPKKEKPMLNEEVTVPTPTARQHSKYRAGQYVIVRMNGDNGDLIVGEIKSARACKDIVGVNLLTGERFTKNEDVLLKRNLVVFKKVAMQVVDQYKNALASGALPAEARKMARAVAVQLANPQQTLRLVEETQRDVPTQAMRIPTEAEVVIDIFRRLSAEDRRQVMEGITKILIGTDLLVLGDAMKLRLILSEIIRMGLEAIEPMLPRPRIIWDRQGKTPYLSRYYLFGGPRTTMKNAFDEKGSPRPGVEWPALPFNLYLHKFHRGDDDTALHSHPWEWAVSLVLAGGYIEERRERGKSRDLWDVKKRLVLPLSLNFIDETDFHRVDLIGDAESWSLFLAGPKSDTWYFWDRDNYQTYRWYDYISLVRGR